VTRILRIDSSARQGDSVSRALTDRIVARLGGGAAVRDLAERPPVLVTEEIVAAYFTPPGERTEAQRAAVAPSDAVVAELRAAEVIVIGLPIYNFGPPAALKGWADMAARVGVTFEYGEDGPRGLLEGKRAIVAVASGGTGSGSALDHATPWLRHFLGFIGIEDVTIIAADQLGRESDDKTARAYEAADAVEPLAA
jgi:FMN-dependent NADH-azoreductase